MAHPTDHQTCAASPLVISRALAGGQMNIAITMIEADRVEGRDGGDGGGR